MKCFSHHSNSGKSPIPNRLLKNEVGSITAFVGIFLGFFGVALISALYVMHHWRQQTELQLRLDECVGGKAINLASKLKTIDEINRIIKIARPVIMTTMVIPVTAPAAEIAQKALVALGVIQTGIIVYWNDVTRALWVAKQGCDHEFKGYNFMNLVLPEIPYPGLGRKYDELGPLPLEWPAGQEKKLTISLTHSPRSASAVVEYKTGDEKPAGRFNAGISPTSKRKPNENTQSEEPYDENSKGWHPRWTHQFGSGWTKYY